jgi:UDP-glucose 4-epimerase
MMSIEDAVDLVLFAFEHGAPGDLFVQKAPAASVKTLAEGIKRVFPSASVLEVIGTRHGEKRSETLLTREERVRAEDMGSYYRVGSVIGNLDYDTFFSEGEEPLSGAEDYNSDNTRQLNVEEMVEILRKLRCVQEPLMQLAAR